MKKLSLFFFAILCSFSLINNALATDWSVGELTCNYINKDKKISLTYYNVGAALGDAEVYYRIIYSDGDTNYCTMGNSFISKCPPDSILNWYIDIYNYDSIFKYDGVQFYSIKNRLIRHSYNEETNFNEDNLCSKAVLLTEFEGVSEVVLCETDENEATCNYESSSLFTLNGKTIGINSYAGASNPDYTTSYNNARSDKEKYCDEASSDYDALKCEEATADVTTTVEVAESNGTTEEFLNSQYQELKNKTDLDFKVTDECSSILGSTEHKENPDPAYYLQFAFNLMKYIALVLLFILTVVEFGKATASNNQDAMKKAINNTVKRLIIAIIIFFLPILIKFVLTLVGIYSADTCGIK